MNRLVLFSAVAAMILVSSLHVRSQAPAAGGAIEALQTIKAQNQKALDQQKATLQKIEQIEKDTHQLRILARRV